LAVISTGFNGGGLGSNVSTAIDGTPPEARLVGDATYTTYITLTI